MFAKLLGFCQLRELTVGENLYRIGDNSGSYYYVLRGQLHLTVFKDGQKLLNKSIDEDSFFGFRESERLPRIDDATAMSSRTEVIEIDTKVYRKIIDDATLEEAEKKI